MASRYWSFGPEETVTLIKGARAVAAVIEHASHNKVRGFPDRACVCCECRFGSPRGQDFSLTSKRVRHRKNSDKLGQERIFQVKANLP